MTAKQPGGKKHPQQSKKRRDKQRAAQPSGGVAAPVQSELFSTANVAAAAPEPKKAEKPSPRYPYIVSELKRLGVLAGILLAALIVISLFLS